MFLERQDDDGVRELNCGWGVTLWRGGGVTMTTTCAGLCMQATQYSSITQCMKTASDEHGKEAKRWVARDAWRGGGGECGGGGFRLDSCYYEGHLVWEGGGAGY
jgi:hypothetical protein